MLNEVGDALYIELDDLACSSEFLAKAIADLDLSHITSQHQRGLATLMDSFTTRLRAAASKLGDEVYPGVAHAPDLTEPISQEECTRKSA